LGSLIVLAVPITGLTHLHLGDPVMEELPPGNDARQGYDAAAAAFTPGIVGPTMILVEGRGVGHDGRALSSFQSQIDAEPGVTAVIGPGNVRLHAPQQAFLSPSGNAARFIVLLSTDPEGSPAIETLHRLEAA